MQGVESGVELPEISAESYIVCDIKSALEAFSSLSLFCIRAQISLNGMDFGPSGNSNSNLNGSANGNGSGNDNNCMIICHSFQPLSISPTSCQCPCPIPMENVQTVLKEICVTGESFFPSKDLPSTLHLQATLTASISLKTATATAIEGEGEIIKNEKLIHGIDPVKSASISSTSNKSSDEEETVSIIVPVRCTSQEELYFIPPTLNQILALFKSRNIVSEISAIRTWVQFQMLMTADNGTVGGSKNIRGSLQLKKLSFVSSLESAVALGPGSCQLEGIVKSLSPPLGPIAERGGIEHGMLTLDLFNPQPILISPSVCRRPGGTVLTIQGALQGGLRCLPYPDLVKVLLTASGAEIELALAVPDVTVLTVRNDVIKVLNQDGSEKCEIILGAEAGLGLGLGTQPLENEGKDGDSSGAERSAAVSREGSPLKATRGSFNNMKALIESDDMDVVEVEVGVQDDLDNVDPEYRIRFKMPDLTGFFSDVEIATGVAPDSIVVTLLLDGESRVPINHSYKIMMFDGLKVGNITNPKGGNTYGSQVTVSAIGLPDIVTSCIVRIRGDEKEKDKDKDKDREKGSTIPRTGYLPFLKHTDVSGMKSRSSSGSTEITFIVPDGDLMNRMQPIIVKKAKMFFIEISVDGGSSFDSSISPIFQIV